MPVTKKSQKKCNKPYDKPAEKEPIDKKTALRNSYEAILDSSNKINDIITKMIEEIGEMRDEISRTKKSFAELTAHAEEPQNVTKDLADVANVAVAAAVDNKE
jgi:uncharacterized coiled-coil DUF342 family protein